MTRSDSAARPGLPWAWLTALVLTLAAIYGGDAWKQHVEHPELVPSASILAILAGVLARNALMLPATLRRGSKSIIKLVIPASIVLLGAGLDLEALADPQLGVGGLAITIACMLVALLAAFGAGKLMGLTGRTAGLLAAGTAVCGSSAIMAVAPVLEAEDDEIVVALGTVNLMGLLAMLAVPALAAAFGLADEAAGLFAGTSVHAVPLQRDSRRCSRWCASRCSRRWCSVSARSSRGDARAVRHMNAAVASARSCRSSSGASSPSRRCARRGCSTATSAPSRSAMHSPTGASTC
jgi:hypothetical protein